MPKLIQRDLSVKSGKITFSIEARAGSIAVIGDSGIGKSRYFDAMRLCHSYFNDNSTKFIFVNYESYTPDLVRSLLETQHNKIIFIDNADILIDEYTSMNLVSRTDNQLVFIGRQLVLFDVLDKNAAYLRRKGNTFYLEYMRG